MLTFMTHFTMRCPKCGTHDAITMMRYYDGVKGRSRFGRRHAITEVKITDETKRDP